MPKLPNPEKSGATILEFQTWLETVDSGDLHTWLMDAFYKGQLDQTELYRFFLLHQRRADSVVEAARPCMCGHPQRKG